MDQSIQFTGSTGMLNKMISKRTLLNGGIILLICIALTLPAAAIDLNPVNYIMKKPVAVQTVNKTMVNHAPGSPVEMGTILPRVTAAVSPVDVPTMSHVSSGTGTCSQDTPATVLEGTITEIQYTDVYDTTFTFMKLKAGGEAALFPVDGGNRDRMYRLFETAYIKGNTIQVITRGGCSLATYSTFGGTSKQYPSYQILMIDLGPVHP